MKIRSNTAVTIEYRLSLDDGKVVDEADATDPLTYIHGNGLLLTALENALENKEVGDSLEITLAPADAYGEFDAGRVLEVPRAEIAMANILKVGQRLSFGSLRAVVQRISDDTIWLDGNHPLAGKRLHFAVTVKEIRPATPIELGDLRQS